MKFSSNIVFFALFILIVCISSGTNHIINNSLTGYYLFPWLSNVDLTLSNGHFIFDPFPDSDRGIDVDINDKSYRYGSTSILCFLSLIVGLSPLNIYKIPLGMTIIFIGALYFFNSLGNGNKKITFCSFILFAPIFVLSYKHAELIFGLRSFTFGWFLCLIYCGLIYNIIFNRRNNYIFNVILSLIIFWVALVTYQTIGINLIIINVILYLCGTLSFYFGPSISRGKYVPNFNSLIYIVILSLIILFLDPILSSLLSIGGNLPSPIAALSSLVSSYLNDNASNMFEYYRGYSQISQYLIIIPVLFNLILYGSIFIWNRSSPKILTYNIKNSDSVHQWIFCNALILAGLIHTFIMLLFGWKRFEFLFLISSVAVPIMLVYSLCIWRNQNNHQNSGSCVCVSRKWYFCVLVLLLLINTTSYFILINDNYGSTKYTSDSENNLSLFVSENNFSKIFANMKLANLITIYNHSVPVNIFTVNPEYFSSSSDFISFLYSQSIDEFIEGFKERGYDYIIITDENLEQTLQLVNYDVMPLNNYDFDSSDNIDTIYYNGDDTIYSVI